MNRIVVKCLTNHSCLPAKPLVTFKHANTTLLGSFSSCCSYEGKRFVQNVDLLCDLKMACYKMVDALRDNHGIKQ